VRNGIDRRAAFDLAAEIECGARFAGTRLLKKRTEGANERIEGELGCLILTLLPPCRRCTLRCGAMRELSLCHVRCRSLPYDERRAVGRSR